MTQDASRPPRRPAGAGKKPASAKPAASAKAAASGKPAPGKPVPRTPAVSEPHRPATKATTTTSPAAVRAGWLSGIRFSGFSLIMVGVLVLAVVVLAPTVAAFAQQRQQIAELRAAVSAQEEEVQRLRDERERWNDETFIMTQARERLYYVMPGEVSYLVIDDRSDAAKADAATEVSAEVTESKGDWMRTLLDSVMIAGLAPEPTAPAEGSDG
ncbi:FtsB family cell division protein [Agromyces bauzanensis]|uniref:Septum formation initiator family protein n=1 Tax=Agromyces bauzanensis TaxID=1308924 RepID=A0A917ULQ4_9MICO|nr:septum formation initiator family protein [Agromyces bauzanensis]GGJ66748.1 hypothetical protein GCM10011372_00540 [Agromyces bauzanensis]